MRRFRSRRGNSLLEFTFLGIPALFLTISVAEMSLTMWQYHTLEESATTGARYVIVHGSDCTGTCGLNVGQVITAITQTGVGLDPTKLSVTLTSSSGSTTYSPASNYLSSSTAFPPAADSTVGSDITVTLKLPVRNPFLMLWPGAGTTSDVPVTLQAVSRQRIIF